MISRFQRMRGFKRAAPHGLDAFGCRLRTMPSNGRKPAGPTRATSPTTTGQMDMIGLSFDLVAQITSCYPDYYRWTSGSPAHVRARPGLPRHRPAGWCPSTRPFSPTSQVEQGRCWRCGSESPRSTPSSGIFAYRLRQRLLDDLATIDWPREDQLMQTNWIRAVRVLEVEFALRGAMTALRSSPRAPTRCTARVTWLLAPRTPAGRRAHPPPTACRRGHLPGRGRRESRESKRLSTEKTRPGVTGAYP